MGLFTKQDVIGALTRLGELAAARGESIDLVLVGGGVMVLEFEARVSTRDLDVVILPPSEPSSVRASRQSYRKSVLGQMIGSMMPQRAFSSV